MTQQSNQQNQIDLLSVQRDSYGSNYDAHLFEQYKLYVEMADRISARRMLANSFFLGINTTLVTVFSTLFFQFEMSALWIIPPLVAVLLLCFVWWRMVNSYRQLNSGKYKVVGEIEKLLPLKPYAAEWVSLGKGKDRKLYHPLTHVENWIPILFAILYCLLALVFFVNDASAGKTPPASQTKTVEKTESPEKKVESPDKAEPTNPKQ